MVTTTVTKTVTKTTKNPTKKTTKGADGPKKTDGPKKKATAKVQKKTPKKALKRNKVELALRIALIADK